MLAPGADALLVLFDAGRVRERNDYLDPLQSIEGIDRAWVHGELLLEGGRIGVPARRPGRALLTVVGGG